MSEILEVYEKLVTGENQLCRRIETLDILQSVHRHGTQLDTLTVEDALMTIHRMQQDLQIELHARLEKSILAHRHSEYKGAHKQDRQPRYGTEYFTTFGLNLSP
ncbi:hypothetical protein [Paenibacillus sp. RC67]|uniref:hypothetical protein n=1 Tax=Paenibacillus sp. RC67 TaxID=3039392 RepID=UPI0024AD651A|nr:hypothetical protein [Paenibacillus sp. RC67]